MEFYGLLAVSMLEEQKMFLNAQWNAMEVNFVQKSYIVTFCYSLTCLPGSITKMFHVPSGICTYILYHSAILVLWNGTVVDYCLFSCCLYILRVIIVYISTYAGHLDLAETERITITSLSLCWLWATTLKVFIRWLWILLLRSDPNYKSFQESWRVKPSQNLTKIIERNTKIYDIK